MATPKYKPTAEKRRMVEVLMSGGVPKRTIARALSIGQQTLRQYYAEELAHGAEMANARVVQRLFLLIQQGSTPATIFWLKARAGWKEGQRIEVETPPPSIDVSTLPREERDDLRVLLTKTTAPQLTTVQ